MKILDDLESSSAHMLALFSKATRIVAFTGAGASAASGVPTYRGVGGQWTRYDPQKYASIAHFEKDPSYYWSFFRDERYPALAGAEPSAVHFSLAKLQSEGRLEALITQNIDGLHQRGGSTDVLELHGNSRRFPCQSCGVVHDFEETRRLLDESMPPRCGSCGEQALRPGVVLFGEALPADVLDRAFAASRRADLFIVVGSSLVVQPAASLPVEALRSGATLVIMNIDPTPLDKLAEVLIRVPSDQVLPLVVRALIPGGSS